MQLFSKRKTESEICSQKGCPTLDFLFWEYNRSMMLHLYSDQDKGCLPRLKATHSLDLNSKMIKTPERARSGLLNVQIGEKQKDYDSKTIETL